MATKYLRLAVAVLSVMIAMTTASFAQQPIKKQLDYTIDVEYRLRMGNYLLPPGKYVLRQADENHLNLFWLFQDDRRNSPIAAVHTAPRNNLKNHYPRHTEVQWWIDEESAASPIPVLAGWDAPNYDGFEITSVVPNGAGKSLLIKVR